MRPERCVTGRDATGFEDPQLGKHMHSIHFTPNLYAVPWFLTWFSHMLPLDQVGPYSPRSHRPMVPPLIRFSCFGIACCWPRLLSQYLSLLQLSGIDTSKKNRRSGLMSCLFRGVRTLLLSLDFDECVMYFSQVG